MLGVACRRGDEDDICHDLLSVVSHLLEHVVQLAYDVCYVCTFL